MLFNSIRPSLGNVSRGLHSALRTPNSASLLSTLAILEQRDGQLNQGSLSAITAAKKLGGSVHAFIAGSDVSGAAQEAAKVAGIEKVVKVSNNAYEKVLTDQLHHGTGRLLPSSTSRTFLDSR